MEQFRIHLDQRGMSGRWVRYRVLSANEVQDIETRAAARAALQEHETPEQRQAAARAVEFEYGLSAMLTAVTTEPAKEITDKTHWQSLTEAELLTTGAPGSLSKVFPNPREYAFL